MATQGRIPPVHNEPHKIQLARLIHVHYTHADLHGFEKFADAFGFVEEARSSLSSPSVPETIYYRGYGQDLYTYAASAAAEGSGSQFEGAAFLAKSESDFVKASQLSRNSTVQPHVGPGGGRMVRVVAPSGITIFVIWGIEEHSEPVEAVTATEVHKGPYNTALHKCRKGETQRFRVGPAMVHKLGHYGCVTARFDEDIAFFTQKFNFVPSDILWEPQPDGSERDALVFMHLDHGTVYTDHHTLFLSRAPPGPPPGPQGALFRVHHTSFEVEDFDTQLLGHQHLLDRGYTPIWGVGRHVLGSQIFDYWRDPSGFAIEHYADGDLVNADVPTGREKSKGAASMYVWGPVRPNAGVA